MRTGQQLPVLLSDHPNTVPGLLDKREPSTECLLTGGAPSSASAALRGVAWNEAQWPLPGRLTKVQASWAASRMEESRPDPPVAWATSTMKPPITVLITTMKALMTITIPRSEP
jgi:hypothetical protein